MGRDVAEVRIFKISFGESFGVAEDPLKVAEG